MTTYTLTGLLEIDPSNAEAVLERDATLAVFVGAGSQATFSYTGRSFVDSDGDVIVETDLNPSEGIFALLNGEIFNDDVEDTILQVNWGGGNQTTVLLFNSFISGTGTDFNWIFEIGGDRFPDFASSAALDAFEVQVDSFGLSNDPALAPNTDIAFSSLPRVVVTEDDVVLSEDGDDLIASGIGNDRITSGAGADTVNAGDGADTVIAGAGNDSVTGGDTEADLRDVIYGGSGKDTIEGGHGNDELRGDAGDDILAGGFGTDTVIGGTGNDAMTGSAFSDLLFGGDGADFVNGGFGSDRVNGGADGDRFYHLGIADHGSDWIQDFNCDEGDILFFGGTAAVSDFQVNLANTAQAGQDDVDEAFIIYRPTGQIIWALVDGAAQSSIQLRIGSEDFELLG